MLTNADKKISIAALCGFSELTQNVISSSHGHSTSWLKMSCKSVQPLSCNLADKKQRKKSIENNTPSPIVSRVGQLLILLPLQQQQSTTRPEMKHQRCNLSSRPASISKSPSLTQTSRAHSPGGARLQADQPSGKGGPALMAIKRHFTHNMLRYAQTRCSNT